MRFGFSLVLIVPLHRSSVSLTLALYVMMTVFSAGTAANRNDDRTPHQEEQAASGDGSCAGW